MSASAMENETGTGYTIPFNIVTVTFLFISKITLDQMTGILTIVSALIGIGYVAYKWQRDIKKAHREDEEYERKHHDNDDN